MSAWQSVSVKADNSLPAGSPTLYFPDHATYPGLPTSPLLLRTMPGDGRRRHLIVQSAWATSREAGAAFSSSATLGRLGLRPSVAHSVEYREARLWHVLRYGDGTAVAALIALLTVVSTTLSAFVVYKDHVRDATAQTCLWVLIVASASALLGLLAAVRKP
jgi:hypothetical protein